MAHVRVPSVPLLPSCTTTSSRSRSLARAAALRYVCFGSWHLRQISRCRARQRKRRKRDYWRRRRNGQRRSVHRARRRRAVGRRAAKVLRTPSEAAKVLRTPRREVRRSRAIARRAAAAGEQQALRHELVCIYLLVANNSVAATMLVASFNSLGTQDPTRR